MIDIINEQTFAYQKGIQLFRGGFNWNLQFRWYAIPPEMIKSQTDDPTKPIMSVSLLWNQSSISES